MRGSVYVCVRGSVYVCVHSCVCMRGFGRLHEFVRIVCVRVYKTYIDLGLSTETIQSSTARHKVHMLLNYLTTT